MSEAPIDRLLPRLKAVKPTPNGWDALCPAHEDSKPSLGISEGKDGAILLKCRSANCTAKQIVEAVGLTLRDLFPSSNGKHESNGQAKRIKATYQYTDEAGQLLYEVVRFEPKDFRQRRPDASKPGGFDWKLGDVRRVPYRLAELLADPDAVLFIPEGERDVDRLREEQLVATCNAGGAEKWHTLDKATRHNAVSGRCVVILPDNDEPGRKHAQQVARDIKGVAFSIKVVELPGLPDKGDVSDWLKSHDRGELLDLCEAAPEWKPTANNTNAEPPNESQGEPSADSPKSRFGYHWQPIDSAAFFAGDYRPNWLVENVVVDRQPLIIGGPQKALKTSIAIDLAISVASATPALGKFAVRHARKVAVLSGESGPFALQSIARRICEAKFIETATLTGMLTWQFRLPQLAVQEQLDALADGLKRDRPEVIVVDPLYLSLLAGSEARAENLFDMGPLLAQIAQVCDDAGATPWMLHHGKKDTAAKREPLELQDLAMSGIAEFARQWILVNRREKYEPGSGLHQLHVVVGGSVGHNGLYAVDIDEGQLGVDFSGRKWEVTVSTGIEAKRQEKDAKAAEKADRDRERDAADDQAVMTAVDGGKGEPVSYTHARRLARLNNDRMTLAVDRLKRLGLLAEADSVYESGNGAKKKARGLKRKGERQNGGTNAENPTVPPSNGTADGTTYPIGVVPLSTVRSAESRENQESGEAVPPSADAALFVDLPASVAGQHGSGL
jgi:hypothetical protein